MTYNVLMGTGTLNHTHSLTHSLTHSPLSLTVPYILYLVTKPPFLPPIPSSQHPRERHLPLREPMMCRLVFGVVNVATVQLFAILIAILFQQALLLTILQYFVEIKSIVILLISIFRPTLHFVLVFFLHLCYYNLLYLRPPAWMAIWPIWQPFIT